MKYSFVGLFVGIIGFTATAFATDDKTSTNASLKAVTVYRSGAEMQHIATANLPKGNTELVIENIANQLDANSVQIKAPGAVTVLGIEFANNYLAGSNKTPRMKMLEDSAAHIQKEVEKIQLQKNNAEELQQVLRANKEIKGTQTGLSVIELSKLLDFYKTKLQELQNETAKLSQTQKKLNELYQKMQAQIQEEEQKNTQSTGKLILQLSVAIAGKYDFAIAYLAPNAWWNPFYDIKVENTIAPVKMVYRAKLAQTTGIDWKQVKLTLSTALPGQKGSLPVLNTWFLNYQYPQARMYKSAMPASVSMNEMAVADVADTKKMMIRGYKDNQQKPIYILNGEEIDAPTYESLNPANIKSVNVLKGSNATAKYGNKAEGGAIEITLKSELADYVTVNDNVLSVVFDIDMPYDVPTNGKEQAAILQSFNVPATYSHSAIPKMDAEAYLIAKLTGWEKQNLLPGDAAVIYEGTYVGKTYINPSITTDSLLLTIAADKRVIVKREKLTDYSSVKFLGSNKQQKFTYEITVRNTKKEPVYITINDQYPISTNNDIEVTLTDVGKAVVNDASGQLNWQLQLAPGETQKLRFGFTVKYPKDKQLNL